MPAAQIDNVSAGHVVAYDLKTGEVLWTYEKIVEVVPGQTNYPSRLTEVECGQVRADAARVFPGREVGTLMAPEGFALRENVRIAVDPDTRTLREVPDETPTLADRFVLANSPSAR